MAVTCSEVPRFSTRQCAIKAATAGPTKFLRGRASGRPYAVRVGGISGRFLPGLLLDTSGSGMTADISHEEVTHDTDPQTEVAVDAAVLVVVLHHNAALASAKERGCCR